MNPGVMPNNPKQNVRIEYVPDAREPETKRRDRIQARCRRTRNKREGSNPDAIQENPKLKDDIESGRNARELESKQRDRIFA